MAWPRGRRRHDGDGRWLIGVRAVDLAAAAGVSYRTARRWQTGEDLPTVEVLLRLVERLWPLTAGSLPLAGDYPLDGWSRVGGVGEFTIRSARGEPADYDGEADDDGYVRV